MGKLPEDVRVSFREARVLVLRAIDKIPFDGPASKLQYLSMLDEYFPDPGVLEVEEDIRAQPGWFLITGLMGES